MDPRVMELRIKQWISVFNEQANSGMNKNEWCILNGINKTSFYRWQKRVRTYLLEQQGSEEAAVSVLMQNADTAGFVELPSTKGSLAEAYNTRSSYHSGGNDNSAIRIHYGGFSISLDGEVDERQLSSVLRVLRHVD